MGELLAAKSRALCMPPASVGRGCWWGRPATDDRAPTACRLWWCRETPRQKPICRRSVLVWHGHEKIGDTNTEFPHSLFGGCPPVGGGFSLFRCGSGHVAALVQATGLPTAVRSVVAVRYS